MEIEDVAREIVDSAVKVHKAIGPGLLESAYQTCIAYELRSRGLKVACEVPQPVVYERIRLDAGYRIDMLVDESVIIENKTVERILAVHQAQLLTYLRLRGCHLGFLLNWYVPIMRNGIHRFVHELPE